MTRTEEIEAAFTKVTELQGTVRRKLISLQRELEETEAQVREALTEMREQVQIVVSDAAGAAGEKRGGS